MYPVTFPGYSPIKSILESSFFLFILFISKPFVFKLSAIRSIFGKRSLGKILISKIPFVGGWLARKLYPVTYYRIDTASMFMSYAQSSVLKVIEDITNDKGVRALTEAERKPVLNNIFIR